MIYFLFSKNMNAKLWVSNSFRTLAGGGTSQHVSIRPLNGWIISFRTLAGGGTSQLTVYSDSKYAVDIVSVPLRVEVLLNLLQMDAVNVMKIRVSVPLRVEVLLNHQESIYHKSTGTFPYPCGWRYFSTKAKSRHSYSLCIKNLETNNEIVFESEKAKRLPETDERLLMVELLKVAIDAYEERERMYKYKEAIHFDKEADIKEPNTEKYNLFRTVYDGDLKELIEAIKERYGLYSRNILEI